jgi:hypothetical protein
LLDAAETSGFTVLVTGDQNLEFQQNLAKRRLGVVVVLCAATNALDDLSPLIPKALAAIDIVRPGEVIRIQA